MIAIVLSGLGLVRDVPYTGPRGVDPVGSVLSVLGWAASCSNPGMAGRRWPLLLCWRPVRLQWERWSLAGSAPPSRQTDAARPDLFRSKMFRLGVSQQMLQQIARGRHDRPAHLPADGARVQRHGAGLSFAPLSLSMFGVAILAGKKAGARRPASIVLGIRPPHDRNGDPHPDRAESGLWLVAS